MAQVLDASEPPAAELKAAPHAAAARRAGAAFLDRGQRAVVYLILHAARLLSRTQHQQQAWERWTSPGAAPPRRQPAAGQPPAAWMPPPATPCCPSRQRCCTRHVGSADERWRWWARPPAALPLPARRSAPLPRRFPAPSRTPMLTGVGRAAAPAGPRPPAHRGGGRGAGGAGAGARHAAARPRRARWPNGWAATTCGPCRCRPAAAARPVPTHLQASGSRGWAPRRRQQARQLGELEQRRHRGQRVVAWRQRRREHHALGRPGLLGAAARLPDAQGALQSPARAAVQGLGRRGSSPARALLGSSGAPPAAHVPPPLPSYPPLASRWASCPGSSPPPTPRLPAAPPQTPSMRVGGRLARGPVGTLLGWPQGFQPAAPAVAARWLDIRHLPGRHALPSYAPPRPAVTLSAGTSDEVVGVLEAVLESASVYRWGAGWVGEWVAGGRLGGWLVCGTSDGARPGPDGALPRVPPRAVL